MIDRQKEKEAGACRRHHLRRKGNRSGKNDSFLFAGITVAESPAVICETVATLLGPSHGTELSLTKKRCYMENEG